MSIKKYVAWITGLLSLLTGALPVAADEQAQASDPPSVRTFTACYTYGWDQCANFVSRASRKEFTSFVLVTSFHLAPFVLLWIFLRQLAERVEGSVDWNFFARENPLQEPLRWLNHAFSAYLLLGWIPLPALTVRRIHDIGLPAWLWALALMVMGLVVHTLNDPYAHILWLMFPLLWMSMKSDRSDGARQHGDGVMA